MGSFNTTCFASQQTIASGDECYVIPIHQNASYKPVAMEINGESFSQHGITCSTCYPNGFWVPNGGYIEAVYDDYGQVKVKNTGANRVRMFHLIEKLYARAPLVAQGENKYHDVPYDLKGFVAAKTPLLLSMLDRSKEKDAYTGPKSPEVLFAELGLVWEYTWEAAHEHRLFIKNPNRSIAAQQFAVMHKVAFDTLVTEVAKQKTWDNKSLDLRTYFNGALDLVKLDFSVAFSPEFPFDKTEYIRRSFQNALGSFGAMEGIYWDYEFTEIQHIVAAYVKGPEIDEELLFEKFKPILEGRYATVGLMQHNLKFLPLVYASQDYDNSVGRGYMKFVQTVSRAVTKQRKDMD